MYGGRGTSKHAQKRKIDSQLQNLKAQSCDCDYIKPCENLLCYVQLVLQGNFEHVLIAVRLADGGTASLRMCDQV